VLTNFDNVRQWFNTLIPPSYESAVVTVDCISRLSGPDYAFSAMTLYWQHKVVVELCRFDITRRLAAVTTFFYLVHRTLILKLS